MSFRSLHVKDTGSTLSLILVITNSKSQVSQPHYSRVSPPICSSLWCYYVPIASRDGCLLSDTFLLCPTESRVWLGLEAAGRSLMTFLTQQPAEFRDRSHWAKFLEAVVEWPPGTHQRTCPSLLPAAAAPSQWSSAPFLFPLKAEVTPSFTLTQTMSWREIAEIPCCHHELRKHWTLLRQSAACSGTVPVCT